MNPSQPLPSAGPLAADYLRALDRGSVPPELVAAIAAEYRKSQGLPPRHARRIHLR